MSAFAKKALKLLLSLAVTAVLLWLAFKDTDWSGMWASLRTANYFWIFPYFSVLLLIHVFRTLRWGALLSGLEKVPFRKLNEASGIGFMMLLILPFRLGEFARPFLIAQRSGIRRSAAMASVVLERIVDGLFVASMLRILLFFVPTEGKHIMLVRNGANLMFAVFGGGLLFLLFATWQRERAVALVRATAGRLSTALADKVAHVVDTFVGAMRQLPDGRHTALFFLYTVIYWALNGVGMTLLSYAFPPDAQIGIFESYVVLAVLIVFLMIPAAPGMVGTFQMGVKIGLTLFVPEHVINTSGLAYANVLWLCQTVQQISLGMILLSMSQTSFGQLAGKLGKNDPGSETPPGREEKSSVAAG